MPRTITSLQGYVRKIPEFQPDDDEVLLYRGHSDRRYKLLPSVLRNNQLAQSESTMLRELIASHPGEFSTDATTLEQLVRAQHYGLPTRLLDATWNPLVALYFACNEHDGVTGEVIVFRIKKALVKFYDSDTVSCIANLAHLKHTERQKIDFTVMGDEFNKQPAVDRLLQFIRAEKPHFRPSIKPSDLKSVVCVKPKLSNRRILVQAGAFLLFGEHGALDEDSVDGINPERIKVNGNTKDNIIRQLDRMAINQSSMFPEIERAAEYIRDKI